MTEYSDQERQTLRTAAFGAVFLVSSADPGVIDLVKESFAASKAFTSSSPDLQTVLKTGGLPQLPKGSPAEMEAGVINALQQSTSILAAKGQSELDGFRSVVMGAVDQAAGAAGGGTSESESAAIGKVKAALGVG